MLYHKAEYCEELKYSNLKLCTATAYSMRINNAKMSKRTSYCMLSQSINQGLVRRGKFTD